ncbi:hypothetical protein PIB30_019436 [Stylosanthes scabra]|uniref:Uncharacterized protein n=1 Tax=Stylosanthes scabra TaxID=79078 RepID=A0ABU6R8J9_9FABA|nr:hypothetical protein [Stylosanthes scabra]
MHESQSAHLMEPEPYLTVELSEDHSHFRIIKTLQISMVSTPAALLLLESLMLFANEATSETNTNHTHHIPTGSWLSPTANILHGHHHLFSLLLAFTRILLLTQPKHTIVWTYNRPTSSLSSNSTLRLTKEHWILLHQGNEDPNFFNSYFIYYPALGMVVVSASILDSGNFGQGEENLAACRVNSTCEAEDVYWVKKAYYEDHGSAQLSLSIEGSLCLKDDVSGSELECSATSKNLYRQAKEHNFYDFIYRATLDEDGDFRLYAHQFKGNTSLGVQVLWEAVVDKCQVPPCGLEDPTMMGGSPYLVVPM